MDWKRRWNDRATITSLERNESNHTDTYVCIFHILLPKLPYFITEKVLGLLNFIRNEVVGS